MSESVALRDQANADVLTCIEAAVDAACTHHFEQGVEHISRALAIYEGCPTAVHDPSTQMHNLLACIRCLRSLCDIAGCPENVRGIQARAEALQRPLQ